MWQALIKLIHAHHWNISTSTHQHRESVTLAIVCNKQSVSERSQAKYPNKSIKSVIYLVK